MVEKLLNFIISHILSSDNATVKKIDGENELYEIQNTGNETGKIIGKEGSIIKAIRNIISITVTKNDLNQKPYIRISE